MSGARFAEDTDGLRQAIVANTDQHQFLGAGAGAGKTSTLVGHYFHLLTTGLRPSQLVAVTFTEKAAAEMKQRLRERCRKQAQQCRVEAHPEAERWESLLHELEVAPISTIHGLCARLLRENALVAGLDPAFGVLAEVETQILLDEAVRQTLLSRLGEAPTADALVVALGYEAAVSHLSRLVQDRVQLEEILDAPQYREADSLLAYWREWVEARQGALLREIVSHPQWAPSLALIAEHQGPPADKLTGLQDQLREIIVEHGLRNWSAAALQPEQYPARIEALRALHSVRAPSNWGNPAQWVATGCDKADMAAAQSHFTHKEGVIAQLIQQLQAYASDPESDRTCAELTCALVAETAAGVEAFARAKAERSVLDFEDLMERTRWLWRERSEALQRVRRTLRHLMIDEFQDTNTLQKQVLWPLVTGRGYDPHQTEALPDGGVRLFVVGDAKQSIYRFRNADVAVFNTTRAEMATAGCRNDELTRNFRSNGALIGVFNELFGHEAVLGTESRETWEAEYAAMQEHRGQPPAGQSPLEIHLQAAMRHAASEDDDGETDDAGVRALREKEARWLAGRLLKLVQSDEIKVDRARDGADWRPVRPGDIAILFRTLTDVSLYERALREAGLPYYLVVGRGFFGAQEVRDVVHLLRALENSLDDLALVGALRSPLFGSSDETLYWLGQMGPGPWWDRLQQAAAGGGTDRLAAVAANLKGEQRSRLQRAAALLADLRRDKNRLPLSVLVQETLDRTGFPAVLAAQFGGSQLVSNVRKLVELAGEFEISRQAQGQSSLRDFIEHLRRMTTEEVREGQAPVEEEAGDSIKLITFHSAKGLQWPVVVAPDLCRKPGGGFPPPYRCHRDLGLVLKATRLVRSGDSDSYWPPLAQLIKERNEAEEVAENHRLFYVAATRAQDLLILSGVTQLSTGEKSSGAVHADARKGALGWINEALGGALWAETGNTAGDTLWRWRENYLEIQSDLATAEGVFINAGSQTEPPRLDLPALHRRIAPVAVSECGQWRFTATELSLYAHCPRLYELQMRLGLPGLAPTFGSTGGDGALSAVELGTVIHQVLQLVGSGGLARLDELVPQGATVLHLNTLLDKRAAQRPELIREPVLEFLGSSLYAELFRPDSDLRSEVGLATRLDVDGREVVVEGKIDALVQTADGHRHVLDYKTGREDHTKEHQYRVQIGLYCYAIGQATGQPPTSARLIYLPKSGLKEISLPVEETKQEAIMSATSAIRGIWAGKFPPCEQRCEHCLARGCCRP